MNFKALVVLMALCVPTSVQALDNCYSGNWYDPANDGEGINIEVTQDKVVGHFYTWRFTDPQRDVYTLSGVNEANDFVMLDGYNDFYFFGDRVNMYTGDALLEVVDEDNIIFSWIWKHDRVSYPDIMRWCIGSHCSGSVRYTRLTQPTECQ